MDHFETNTQFNTTPKNKKRKSKIFFYIIFAVIFVLAAIGLALYFFRQAPFNLKQPVSQQQNAASQATGTPDVFVSQMLHQEQIPSAIVSIGEKFRHLSFPGFSVVSDVEVKQENSCFAYEQEPIKAEKIKFADGTFGCLVIWQTAEGDMQKAETEFVSQISKAGWQQVTGARAETGSVDEFVKNELSARVYFYSSGKNDIFIEFLSKGK